MPTSLQARGAQDRDVAYLEMPLTTFMELGPLAEAVGDLLAPYTADRRPEIDEAADVPLRAWLRVVVGRDDRTASA